MVRSITRRVHRSVFVTSLISLLITILVLFFAYEDLEWSILAIDFEAEREFLLEHAEKHDHGPISWDTANLKAYYAPASFVGQPPPAVFREQPFPFSGEMTVDGETYRVRSAEVDGGRLYVAKNISLLRRREAVFRNVLIGVCAGVILVSFWLARISSRRLVTPLRQLAEHIGTVPPGRRMQRVPLDFEDKELHAIAETFNGFLDELEAFVKREQLLVGLASHELRTPIAVIRGGLEVITQRNRLGPDDGKTLRRIQQATTEMQANVDAVLKLTRRGQAEDQVELVALGQLTQEVLDELAQSHQVVERVELLMADEVRVMADPVLAKMLLRNLIQNAVQHTADRITVRLMPAFLEVVDTGDGLPEAARRLLRDRQLPASELTSAKGLGLFIAVLACDRLAWELELPETGQGTTLRVWMGRPDSGAAA